MSSRAYSLQEYCDNLRCIKARNVPTIAARLARTITLLPTKFNSRKVTIERVVVDRSGQYFDTVWDELIGSNVASIQGVTLTDSRYILDRLEDLSRSVIKFGVYYSGEVTATTAEFTNDLNRINSGGEFYERIFTIEIGSTNGLTYNELGYKVDQATINDVSAERQYDFYEFLKEMSRKDIFTWVYIIQNFITCSKVNNSVRYNVLKTYSEKLLELVTAVVRIVLDIEHKLDDIRPIKPADVQKTRDTIVPETLTTFDPERDGWNFPEGCQPVSTLNAFYIPRRGNYRIAIKVLYPYTIKEFRIKEELVGLITIQNEAVESGTGATYVTETFALNKGDIVSYLIDKIPGSDSEFDPSKVKVYILDVLDSSDIGYVEPISNYSLQPDDTSLEIYPIETDEVPTAVVNSRVELSSATYKNTRLVVSNEQSDKYDYNYPYHYLIKRISAYEDTSAPITLTFVSKVTPKSICVFWYTSSQSDINLIPVDGLSEIEERYFHESDGWINITSIIRTIVNSIIANDGADSSFTTISKHISISDVSDISGSTMKDDGVYQYGMLFTRPLGIYSVPEQAYIGVGGSITSNADGTNIFTNENTTVEVPSSNVVITKTETIETEDVYDFLVNISLNGAASASISSLYMALLRGTKVYVRRVSDLSCYMRVIPYRTIQSTDGSITEQPPYLKKMQPENTNKFLSLDGDEIEFRNKYAVDVPARQILAFSRRLIRDGNSTIYSEPIFHIIKKVSDPPYYREVRRVVINPRVTYDDVVDALMDENYVSKTPDVSVVETTGADVFGGRLNYGVSNSKNASQEVSQVCTEYLSIDDDCTVIISVDTTTSEYGTGTGTGGYSCTNILPYPIYNRRLEQRMLETNYYSADPKRYDDYGFGYWAYKLQSQGLYWIEFTRNLVESTPYVLWRYSSGAYESDVDRCPQIYYTTDPNAANESADNGIMTGKFGTDTGWNVIINSRSRGKLTFKGIEYKLLDSTEHTQYTRVNSSWRHVYNQHSGTHRIGDPYMSSKLFNLTTDSDGKPITGLMMLTPAIGAYFDSIDASGTKGCQFTYKVARIGD